MRSSCVRHVFATFNCLFLLFGCVLMALGLFAKFDSKFVHRLVTFVDGIDDVFTGDDDDAAASASPTTSSSTESSSSSSSSTSEFEAVATYVRLMSHGVIALGGAIFVVALTGCCGAWRQSKRCLGLFFTLLLLCLLLTLLLGGALFFAAVASGAERQNGNPASSSSSSSTASSGPLDPVVAKIASGFKSLVESAWKALTHSQRLAFERANGCCSLYDPTDLFSVLRRADCGAEMGSRGCFDKVVGKIGRNFAIFGAAMMLLAAIEVAAMSISCVIFQNIRQAYAAV